MEKKSSKLKENTRKTNNLLLKGAKDYLGPTRIFINLRVIITKSESIIAVLLGREMGVEILSVAKKKKILMALFALKTRDAKLGRPS